MFNFDSLQPSSADPASASSFAEDPSESNADYSTRPATLADLAAIVEVLITSFYPLNPFNRWLYPVMRVGIHEDLKLRLRSHSRYYYCLAAITTDNTVVGTAEVALRSPFPLFPQRAYVSNLAVSDAHRRRGVARQLLQSCETLAQSWGYRTIYLHVANDNVPAQQLYEKLGYHAAPSELEILAQQFGLPYQKQLRAKPLV